MREGVSGSPAGLRAGITPHTLSGLLDCVLYVSVCVCLCVLAGPTTTDWDRMMVAVLVEIAQVG